MIEKRDSITKIKRGDIFWCDLGLGDGSRQGGIRPCLVIQNDIGNTYAPTIIVACITSKLCKRMLPTHVSVKAGGNSGLKKDSIILTEQITTVDKKNVGDYVGSISIEELKSVNDALGVSMDNKELQQNKDKDLEELKVQKTYLEKFIKKWMDKTGDANAIKEELEEYKQIKLKFERRNVMLNVHNMQKISA